MCELLLTWARWVHIDHLHLGFLISLCLTLRKPFFGCSCQLSNVHDAVQVFGSRGFLDFWISISSTTGWAIELLRNGDRSAQHAARFSENGIYSGIPMTAFALIDFRQGQGPGAVLQRLPGFWHVVFDPDFSQASIWSSVEGGVASCQTCKLMP